ncbi:MAG: DUF4332 domain-containing protein [Candidatus Helarchaeota archaeon]|nr:DUF4332 domain-containing protein [Candidatus Helarchaeota archaeon]
MQENQDEKMMMEIKDTIEDRYFTYAQELYSKLEDQSSEKSLMLKKEIYDVFYEQSSKFIEDRVKKRIKNHLKKKNFRLLDLELTIVEKNLEFLENIILRLNPDEKIERKLAIDIYPWKELHRKLESFGPKIRKELKNYREKYNKEVEKTKKSLEKEQKKRRKKEEKEEKKEVEEKKPKVELLLEMYGKKNEDGYIEYLPFLGVTSVRLRILVNEPVTKLIIRPKVSTFYYAENVEWSNYICGMDNENIKHDLRKGVVALFGGGKKQGFIMFNPPAESYAFFFLRHHDKAIKEQIDYSITFEAIEEISKSEENLLATITVQLKYPEAIRPKEEKKIPDINDPLCPIHPNYKYEYGMKSVGFLYFKEEYREITFKGNMIPEYYPRWWPPWKIKYFPVKNQDKISNLVVRSYPDGAAKVFYKFNGEIQQIGELKGRLTPAVFNDPLLMTTAEVFRFFSDDFIVLRVWFWWFDLRMNAKRWRLKHEMPDCERVDFLIDLRNPSKDIRMIPFIGTDVHWKEFWLDTRDVEKQIRVKFTAIGMDFINFKQFVAFFSHAVDIVYTPLPAIIYEEYLSLKDPKLFYCVVCGERTVLPANIPAVKVLIEDLTESSCRTRMKSIMEDMTDIVCPECQALIMKEEKLQYLYLFEDYTQFKKHLKDEILDEALAMKYDEKLVEGGGQPISLLPQNCHVPTPKDGITSNAWCSSTVIKPLSLKRITFVEKYEDKIDKIKYISVSDLEGLNQTITVRLAKIGIIKLGDLINTDLKDIEYRINVDGLTEEEIADFLYNLPRWKKMAELYKIKGIGSQYSDLLIEIEVDLDTLRNYTEDPQDLLDKIETYNSTHNDVSRLPSLKDLESWIEQAKLL